MQNEAKHFDAGKLTSQYLLAMHGFDEIALVGEFGARKYGQWNYMSGMAFMRTLGSCVRHLTAFIRGEDSDPESGCPHLAHLCYNALMLMEWQYRGVGTDDRYYTKVSDAEAVKIFNSQVQNVHSPDA